MKFKDYLEEAYINKNKEYFFLLDGRLPLAPKLWSRINKLSKIDLAYHITDLKGLNTIIKIQNRKKQISTFTKGDSTVARGVETGGGILIELSGESTLNIDGDAWTSLDRNGLRWWDLEEMSNRKLPKLDNLRKKLMDIVIEIMNGFDYEIPSNINNPTKYAAFMQENFAQKDKAKFIKMSLDAVENYIKTIDIDNIIQIADEMSKKIYGNLNYYNEVVLHNFKIKNIYAVKPLRETKDFIEIKKLVEEGKLKIDGWTLTTWIEDIDNTKVEFVKDIEEL